MKRYISSLDSLAGFIVPAFIIVLVIGTTTAGYLVSRDSGHDPFSIWAFSAPVMLVALFIAMYCLSPQALVVNTDSITIERRLKPVTIYYADIKSIQQLNDQDLKGSLRTFGNGGLFGYTGRFYKRPYGSMTFYCTQRKNYILIEKNNGKKSVVTPDYPQDFLLELKKYMPGII